MNFIDSQLRAPVRHGVALENGFCSGRMQSADSNAYRPSAKDPLQRLRASSLSNWYAGYARSNATERFAPKSSQAPIDEFQLRTTAPLADGWEALRVANCLLVAAEQLPQVHLLMEGLDWRWNWHGRLGESSQREGSVDLRAGSFVLQVSTACVIAVSHCEDATHRGVRFFNETGAFLTLWATRADAFDAWMEQAIRDCS